MRIRVSIAVFLSMLAVSKTADAAPMCTKPNILILLDISGSMNAKVGGIKKYDQAVTGLSTALTTLQSKANFGLMLFPSPVSTSAYPNPEYSGSADFCRIKTGATEIPFSADAKAAFDAHLQSSGASYFGGPQDTYDTPLFQALNESVAVAGPSKDAGMPTYVIVVSDGIQDCFQRGASYDLATADKYWSTAQGKYLYSETAAAENRVYVRNKTAQLFNRGIPVFAVGFGGGVDPLTLNGIADASNTEKSSECDPGTTQVSSSANCYHQANDPSSLVDALSNIVYRIEGEKCDGIDNNCDGDIDEGGVCDCMPCENGKPGKYVLSEEGEILYCDTYTPEVWDTTCDNIDDDCNGEIDELAWPEVCENGSCTGYAYCENGSYVGCDAPAPTAEVCDGNDNDCDGEEDDGIKCTCDAPGLIDTCGPPNPRGLCKRGTRTCVTQGESRVWGACIGAVYPTDGDICDGEDNDCDGATDEDVYACEPNELPAHCGPTRKECINGMLGSCVATNPQKEFCDAIDNDCDGTIDEDSDVKCPTLCGEGKKTCQPDGKLGECVPLAVAEETCDGIDNNCNKAIDEGCACRHGEEQPCRKNVGECSQGVEKCQYGEWSPQCIGANNGRKEECNGVDDDCDGEIDEKEDGMCAGNQQCVCGACAEPCVDSCSNGAKCISGLCQIDYCQVGMYCKAGRCEEGEGNPDPEVPRVVPPIATEARRAMVRDGCACSDNASLGSTYGTALLIAFVCLRMRRRKS